MDEEQITLNDLKELMDSFLKDSLHEAFITKWIKHKFQEQLKGEIVITEINGKLNVVTFWTATAKILQDFYNKQGCSDPTGEKKKNNFSSSKIIETWDKRNEKLFQILSKQRWNKVARIL